LRTKLQKLFPGYFRPADGDVASVWKSGTFVFDSSALLNVYRYSPETTAAFLEILEKIKNRVWIPYDVAREFLKNRVGVIREHERKYAECITQLRNVAAPIREPRQHPFLSPESLQTVDSTIVAVTAELDKRQREYCKLLKDDQYQAQLLRIVGDVVGDPMSAEEFESQCKVGRQRFDFEIPPGYLDLDKQEPDRYSDYFIWRDTINYAAAAKKSIIFVTNDNTADWWLSGHERDDVARPELVAEFEHSTNQSVLFYQPHILMRLAEKYLGQKVSPEAIEEARAVSAARRQIVASNPMGVQDIFIADSVPELGPTHALAAAFRSGEFGMTMHFFDFNRVTLAGQLGWIAKGQSMATSTMGSYNILANRTLLEWLEGEGRDLAIVAIRRTDNEWQMSRKEGPEVTLSIVPIPNWAPQAYQQQWEWLRTILPRRE
jgi:hypothetical protein